MVFGRLSDTLIGKLFLFKIFSTAIGDFNTDNVPSSGFDNYLIYTIWIISTFFNFVVLLNAVIAIISDIFDQVYENMNKNLLKELVTLMAESELLISRKRLFKNKKYIIIIQKETGELESANAESKIAIIRSHMGKLMKSQDRVLFDIERDLKHYVDKKINIKGEEIEHSTDKKLASVTVQLNNLDLNLKQYQDLWQKVSLLS